LISWDGQIQARWTVKTRRALTELRTVLSSDAAPVDDACVRSDSGGDGGGEVGADVGVCFLGLGGGGDFSGADSPDGFVGDHNFARLKGW
jgi:hypothetical protein